MIFEYLWQNLESILAIGTLLISGYIFFNDPIRRWRFFGYRPTALLVVINPKTRKLVIVKTDNNWSFCQGGIYNSDIYDTVEDIMERELHLKSSDYRLFYTKTIGKADLTKEWQKNYPVFGGISFSSEIKGKGYIACLIMSDIESINETGFGIEEIKIIDDKSAIEIFDHEVKNKEKAVILKKCVKESSRAIELWEKTNNL